MKTTFTLSAALALYMLFGASVVHATLTPIETVKATVVTMMGKWLLIFRKWRATTWHQDRT